MDGWREREKGRDGEAKQALNTNELTHNACPPFLSLLLSLSLPLSHGLDHCLSLTHTLTSSNTCACTLSLSSVSPHPISGAQEVISAT